MVCVEQNYAGKMYCSPNLHNIDAQTYIHPDFPSSDTQAPSITNVQVYDVSASGYWVSCRISDNVGIARISFPTWTVKGGQDDLLWRDNTSWDGTTARFHVKVSDHGNQRGCNYITHIYAWDEAGNVKSVGAPTTFVPSAEGYLDAAVGGDGTVKVRGWAFDWASSSSSINVDIYAGGPAESGVFCGRLKANNKRSDVNKAKGISGNHGFEGTVKVGKRGNVKIYAYALAIKGSGNPQLSPVKTATVLEPKGSAASVVEATYAIRTKMDASKGLDVNELSQKNTANVMLCSWNGGGNQKFTVKSAGDGSYYIIANHSNKAIEVTDGLVSNGANVAQYTQNKSVAQRWFFDGNKDGTYTIRQRQSGLVMDVYGKFTANGTNIMQGTPNGGDNQKFHLVPTDTSRWSVSVADQARTGKALTPAPTVKAGGVAMRAGSDFTVSYKNNKAVGTANVTVRGKGAYTGSKTVTFRIGKSISGASISGVKARTYTGAKQTQTPVVKLGKKTLKKGADYTLSYSGNVNAGKATVKVAGKGNYVGTKSATFAIAKASMSGAAVAVVKSQKYTGKAVKPSPMVIFKGKALKKGPDYTLSYKNNVKCGKATVIVTGKGNFKGTKSLTFKIA